MFAHFTDSHDSLSVKFKLHQSEYMLSCILSGFCSLQFNSTVFTAVQDHTDVNWNIKFAELDLSWPDIGAVCRVTKIVKLTGAVWLLGPAWAGLVKQILLSPEVRRLKTNFISYKFGHHLH